MPRPDLERMTMSEAAYLALERDSDTKHEYVNGVAYAMAGEKTRHNLIASNVLLALGGLLRGRPCRPVGSDQRVYIKSTGGFFYPDVTVFCGKPEDLPGDGMSLTNPSLIVEVTSQSTSHDDLGPKVEHYQRIPTLTDYLVVHQDRSLVEHWARGEDDAFAYGAASSGEVRLESLGVSVPFDEIHDLEIL